MTARWYVIQTKPGQEVRASVALASQDFTVFFPLISKKVRHAGKTETVTRPRFPRYLFVEFNLLERRHGPINNTRGVSHLLCNPQGVPQPVPNRVIETLRARGTTIVDDTGGESLDLKPNTPVRIQDGPFSGYEGLFVSSDRERVELLLDLLGQKVSVSIPSDSVLPVGT